MAFAPFSLRRALVADETLKLVQDQLGLQVETEEENVVVTTPGTGHLHDSWRYASAFAGNYNALVGMGNDGDMARLYEGNDARPTGAFLADHLREHGAKTVIDLCSGCMYDYIYLQGLHDRGDLSFDRIVCNEIDTALHQQGEENISTVQQGHPLASPQCTRYHWQELSQHCTMAEFDMSFCMGNSLSHLPQSDQRVRSFANFAYATGKVFVMDIRNFHKVLAHSDELHTTAKRMMQSGEFTGGNAQLFPGDVANFPLCIAPESIIFAYVRRGEERPYSLVRFYPLLCDQLCAELGQVFGNVDVYLDCVRLDGSLSVEHLASPDGPSAIQCVCTQPKHDVAEQLRK